MAVTTIRGKQVLDGSIQRADLDITTAGQAVVAKIVQGSGITLSSTGGDSGTGDVTIAASVPQGPAGPAGPTGSQGENAFNTTASGFTVPPAGQTTTLTLNDASWVVPGQFVYVDQAGGGGPGSAGELQVTAKSGNTITVLNPMPPGAYGLATVAGPGLLTTLPPLTGSGSQTKTWLRGDNSFQPLPTDSYLSAGFTVPPVGNTVAVQFYGPPYPGWPSIGSGTVYVSDGTTRGFLDLTAYNSASGQLTLTNKGAAPAGSGLAADALVRLDAPAQSASVPTGVIMDFAGATAPLGFLLCNGASYATAAYPALFSVIGYTYGGSGANFNVPDLRSRMAVGAGAGSGLTNRVLAATGGEENHPLTVAELVSHTHTLSSHTHTMGNHTHGYDHYHSLSAHTHAGIDHLHSLQNHTHGMDHYHNWSAQGSHTHSDAGHAHTYNATPQGLVQAASGAGAWAVQQQAANTTTNYASISAAATPAGNTVYASSTSAGWANTGGPSSSTTGAADRSLTTGVPSVDNTNWASQESAGFGTSSGPSTNTSDGPSTNTSGATGSGTAHNTMPPFLALNKIIKI